MIVLLLAGAARADNVLMKSKGLGAAAVGGLGIAVGASAFSDPEPWQGFPKGDGGIPFANDAAAQASGACAVSDVNDLAKALKTPPAAPSEPQGQIRLSTLPAKPAGSDVFDSKAIYQAGQPTTCPAH